MPIDCITFDLDDTLWAIHPIIRRADGVVHRWMEERWPQITRQHDADTLFQHRREYFRRFPELAHDLKQLRWNWMRDIGEQHGYAEHEAEEGFGLFWQERNSVDLFAGASELLHYASENFTVGAITNGNADLEVIGIDGHFDFFLSSADVGVCKPHPDIFAHAITHAGCDPDLIVHIGDDPERDVIGAAQAGMRTIWVNLDQSPWPGGPRPDGEVHHLDELPALLESL